MAFCDEFIIVTNKEYKDIIENQMKVFRGLTYRCVYEEVGRKTTAAIVLSCLQMPLSELFFVVAADHLIEGASYKDDILRAKEYAKQGYLVTFGMDIDKPDTRYGYIHYRGEDVLGFTEKPDEETAKSYKESGDYYLNSGMFVFRNGDFQKELRQASPQIAAAFEAAYPKHKNEGGNIYFEASVMEQLPALPIEKAVFEKTTKGKVIHSRFLWKDIGSLDDLDSDTIQSQYEPQVIANKCENTTVINQSSKKLVLVNHLKDILKKIGRESLGWKFQSFRSFPLLIKLIDARDDLSVQVHPGDEYALEYENEYGKSEMWYIIDCAEDSYIYCGFKRDVTKEEVKQHIADNTLLDLLNKIKVEKGKSYFIPAGTIHAIGKGNLICEVQQNSNSTYRVHDYNRRDKYGNLRKLDIEKALDVLDYSKYEGTDVSECKYFECQMIDCNGQADIEVTEESFVALMVLEGDGSICYEEAKLDLAKGDCIFIPKRNAKMQLIGECELMVVRI